MSVINEDSDVHIQELTDRIAWIIRLRWLAAAGVAVTVWAAPRLFNIKLAEAPLYLITAALAFYNTLLWSITRWVPAARQGFPLLCFANVQISADLVFLTALLHFSGGIESPFVCYFVFHIVIASILLSRRATYLQTALALGLLFGISTLQFTGLLPHYHLTGFTEQEQYRSPLYIFAVLFVVGSMLSFTAFMATSITARLRRREAKIFHLSAALRARAADLEQAYSALQRLEKEKSEYMHRVAHDLRSPLATVEQMLAVISAGRAGQIPEEPLRMLDKTRKRVRQISKLARDLLALSRAREARLTAITKKVDLGAIAAGLENEFRQHPEAASLSLEFQVAPNLPRIIGDPGSLAELLENLISNAVKYTPPHGEVRIILRQEDGHLEIRVIDSGIGIPVEEQSRIFDDFYRAGNARESGKEGTGLGLSIVQAITHAHGGRVSVESRVGFGSTFRVLLPLSPPQKPAPADQQENLDSTQRKGNSSLEDLL
jgi:signal transduction histidine kinase